MNDIIKQLGLEINTIAVFRNITSDSVVSRLISLIEASPDDDMPEFLKRYSAFVCELYAHNADLTEYLLKLVLEDENICIVRKGQGLDADRCISSAAENELHILERLSQLTPQDLAEYSGYDGYLPQWRTHSADFSAEYSRRLENVTRFGYGKWTVSNMFIFRNGSIVPVKYPDKQRLSELYGYERERSEVLENTLALVNGRPAQNVLLYGDAGTGKSSTVKAAVNELSKRGLRLIEITKEQLRDIPQIIDEISDNPLKFIIFIDDLSFTSGEDCFGALKATLEGSVSSRADNMAIYATSNRRHLVRESFADREGDDIHRNDTMQETLSLSARFGLRVNFSRPDKKSYVDIAAKLAQSKGISMDENELALRAEQFAAASGNGRSPRTAKQFVNSLIQSNTAPKGEQ